VRIFITAIFKSVVYIYLKFKLNTVFKLINLKGNK